ncbi:hypothetical protein U875_09690 [Pandoraea pnomenusa 3kgm]|uniref:hypothetical protein n=1 Tax=Pandoraea pnomenusa TaxID=93220 RepID=UPI0003C73BEA|nr:hypothetical protein [Pandoraea pnomenusa]AHB05619.1 hypothetical protein U875_09690 [Pandoraea pnomenusa 3kgm]
MRPQFPSYMRAPLVASFTQSPDFAVLVTSMDAGPDKQRPRNSVARVSRSVQFFVEGLERRNAFEKWVRDDLSGGVLWFDWQDPLSGTTKIARIVGGNVEYSSQGSRDVWFVKFNLETYG